MAFIDLVKSRTSCRSYESTPVSEDVLTKLVEAGRLAPSARNRQEWKFYLASGMKLSQELMQACGGQRFVGEAPAFIAVCGTKSLVMGCGVEANVVDPSIAMSFMLLQAEELGLGMCWLGMFDADSVKKVLGIPAEYDVIACSPIGYPDRKTPVRPRKDMSDVLVYVK